MARAGRDASSEDRAAYQYWRRRDPAGPRVEGSTWDREVATVNGFYRWRSARAWPSKTRLSSDRRGARRGWWREKREAPIPDARRHAISWQPPPSTSPTSTGSG